MKSRQGQFRPDTLEIACAFSTLDLSALSSALRSLIGSPKTPQIQNAQESPQPVEQNLAFPEGTLSGLVELIVAFEDQYLKRWTETATHVGLSVVQCRPLDAAVLLLYSLQSLRPLRIDNELFLPSS
eukprot:m.230200 g.230200  ORF g.230200 m.230200 type:complete len:127 (-) comp17058_c5_seq1:70-450(-)